MKKIIHTRLCKTDTTVYGILSVVDGGQILFSCRTLERLDKVFPAGIYNIRFEYSPKFDTKLWELHNIPGRGEIKIHVANKWEQLEGCIAVGMKHADIDQDGDIDVSESKKALDGFHRAMQGIEGTTISVHNLY